MDISFKPYILNTLIMMIIEINRGTIISDCMNPILTLY